jgi:hypothetical protein
MVQGRRLATLATLLELPHGRVFFGTDCSAHGRTAGEARLRTLLRSGDPSCGSFLRMSLHLLQLGRRKMSPLPRT